MTHPISTGFREDTFGPIKSPTTSPGARTQRSLQNFDIDGERERMPVHIIRAFGVLKMCSQIKMQETSPEKQSSY